MAYQQQQQQLQHWFKLVDLDGSGQISAEELQKALVNGDWTPFHMDTIKLMIDLFDRDQSGTIGYNEFVALWQYITEWQVTFKSYDRDNSNSIDLNELITALHSFGFNLSPNIISKILKRFTKHASKQEKASLRPNVATFDTFIRLCVTLRMVTDSFKQYDNDFDGVIQIGYENFLELVITNK